MIKNAAKGHRKAQHSREFALIVTAALAVVGYLKIPADVFWAYCTVMGGISGAFVWGNIRENQAVLKAPEIPTPPQASH